MPFLQQKHFQGEHTSTQIFSTENNICHKIITSVCYTSDQSTPCATGKFVVRVCVCVCVCVCVRVSVSEWKRISWMQWQQRKWNCTGVDCASQWRVLERTFVRICHFWPFFATFFLWNGKCWEGKSAEIMFPTKVQVKYMHSPNGHLERTIYL